MDENPDPISHESSTSISTENKNQENENEHEIKDNNKQADENYDKIQHQQQPPSSSSRASMEYNNINVTSPTSLALRDSLIDANKISITQSNVKSIDDSRNSNKLQSLNVPGINNDNNGINSNNKRSSARNFFSRRPSSDMSAYNSNKNDNLNKSDNNNQNSSKGTMGRVSSAGTLNDSIVRSRPDRSSSKRSIFRDTVSFLARDSTTQIPANIPVTCEGYLTKRGHVVTNWKTRYFVLKGQILLYYSDETSYKTNESKPLGQVKIEKVAPWTGESHGFMFYTVKQIPYYVYAASGKEKNKWMTCMKDFILQQDPVDCEGYLTKRGHLVPSYRLRYFVLRGNSLKYYSDKDSYMSNGSAALAEMEVISVSRWSGEKTGIVFKTSTGNLLYLYADTVDEQHKWLQCLQLSSGISSLNTNSLSRRTDQLAVSPQQPVSCAGYLKKQGHKRKSWKKRYFVLRGTKLSYYSDYETANTRGGPVIAEIILEDVQLWDGESFGFMITTTSQIPYYLYADNERERSKWISTIRKNLGAVTEENQISKKVCPRCNNRLTGTKFCGACGFKMKSTIMNKSEEYENIPLTVDEESNVADGEKNTKSSSEKTENEDDNETAAFDELEALSEGARTLLLAVMQTPEGVNVGDANSAYQLRMSSRRAFDKTAPTSNHYDSVSGDIDGALKDIDEEFETKEKAEKRNDFERISSDNEVKEEKYLKKERPSKGLQADTSNDSDSNETTIQASTQQNVNSSDKNEFEENKTSKVNIKNVSSRSMVDGKSKKSIEDDEDDNSSFYDDNIELDLRGVPALELQRGQEKPQHLKPASSNNLTKDKDLYPALEKELDFNALYVPSADAPVRCRIYGSMNYFTAAKLVLFISDSGPLGLWKYDSDYQSITVDQPWSMMKFMSRAQEEGYGIVLSNPYSNNVTVYEEGGIERAVSIPGSGTPKEHLCFIWERYITKCSGTISIIAYGKGGELAKHLLQTFESETRKKIHRIAFIESCHEINGTESNELLELIGRRSINWQRSDTEPLGGQIVEAQQRLGCVCLSSGSVPSGGKATEECKALQNAQDSVFAFLKANPERPGMTAVVGYIRSSIRRRGKGNRNNIKRRGVGKSGVVVLGETDNGDDDMTAINEDSSGSGPPSSSPAKGVYLPKTTPTKGNNRGNTSGGPGSSTPYSVNVKDFELTTVVGQGGFGKVFLAKKITEPKAGRFFAMKVLKKKHVLASGLVNTTMAERHILTEINHPFIVKLHYAFQSESKLYLVMDYLSGGSLALHLRKRRKFPELWSRFYAAEVSAAIAHLHSVNIVYRDAKLENVLMDHEGHVRITDFGLSKVGVSGLQGASTFCGTAAYIAPELLQGNSYGKAADWWSFGILLYEMIGGKPPYYHRNRDIMFQTILKQEWVTFTPSFSDSAVSIIRGLLTRDPKNRLGSGVRGADEVLTHPFFKDIDWEKLLQKEIAPPFSPGVSEFDTYYVPRHLLNNDIPNRDREASIVIKGSNQPNVFDGFSFVGRAPNT